MPALYKEGEQILIKPISEQTLSVREAALSPYSGQTGVVANHYWINPPTGEIFYLYTVQVSGSGKEITLYEDEITHLYNTKSKSGKIKNR